MISEGDDCFDLGYSQFSNFYPEIPQLSDTKNSEISLFKADPMKRHK